jgi:phenylpropionate dioxygenase-like ring-hydroxylating dioxygenase large terminal subunit
MKQPQSNTAFKGYDRLWGWFGLSRASWITVPRVLAHEMPDEWQDKMAALLEEYERTFTNWPEGIGTRVLLTDCGHLTVLHNWILNYRYPAKGKIETLRSK